MKIYLDSVSVTADGFDVNMVTQNLISKFQEDVNIDELRHHYDVEDGRKVLIISFSYISGVGCSYYSVLFDRTSRLLSKVYYLLKNTRIESLEGNIEVLVGQ